MFTNLKNKLLEEQNDRAHKEFESFKDKKYSEEDLNKLFENEENILDKMNDDNLKEFVEAVKLLFFMLKDFVTGNYREIPIRTILAITGTLLYILNPFDFIPDYIPGVGYLDDAGFIAVCLKAIKADIDKYKEFKGLCAWNLHTGTLSKNVFFLLQKPP